MPAKLSEQGSLPSAYVFFSFPFFRVLRDGPSFNGESFPEAGHSDCRLVSVAISARRGCRHRHAPEDVGISVTVASFSVSYTAADPNRCSSRGREPGAWGHKVNSEVPVMFGRGSDPKFSAPAYGIPE